MDSEASSQVHTPLGEGCPSSLLKREQSQLSNVEESQLRVLHRKPFKLRFGKHQDLGRSAVSSNKPLGLLPVITSKFYSCEVGKAKADKQMMDKAHRIACQIDGLYNLGPKQKLRFPKLESHKYGWFHNVNLEGDLSHKFPFYHGIHSSPMVKYRISIIANDAIPQKLGKK